MSGTTLCGSSGMRSTIPALIAPLHIRVRFLSAAFVLSLSSSSAAVPVSPLSPTPSRRRGRHSGKLVCGAISHAPRGNVVTGSTPHNTSSAPVRARLLEDHRSEFAEHSHLGAPLRLRHACDAPELVAVAEPHALERERARGGAVVRPRGAELEDDGVGGTQGGVDAAAELDEHIRDDGEREPVRFEPDDALVEELGHG